MELKHNHNKILVSACLLGQAVRYDATDLKQQHYYLTKWHNEHRLVPFCPEVSAGMSIPRVSAEIVGGSGEDVLSGNAKVMDKLQQNVSGFFIKGAQQALELCLQHGIEIAILTEHSPSCAGQFIYNGRFNKTQVRGEGVTTALLRLNHIKVFNQHQINDVSHYVY